MTGVPVTGVEALDVSAGEWTSAAGAAVAGGFTWLGWLSAVDDVEAGAMTVLLLLVRPDTSDARMLRAVVPRDGHLPSLRGLLPGAAWHERETAEMFGLAFSGGDDRRLLLPPGEPLHPLRKDVALGARQGTPWPGAADPSGRARRRSTPPGVLPGRGDAS
jgi:NADH-quinone oxidoreductase subunit C